jgi:hypothetical protein
MAIVNKKISLNLIGLDGNAFALMGAFQRQARKEGWTKEEINTVLEECQHGDYNHLLVTLIEHCEDLECAGDFDIEKDDEEEDSDEPFSSPSNSYSEDGANSYSED